MISKSEISQAVRLFNSNKIDIMRQEFGLRSDTLIFESASYYKNNSMHSLSEILDFVQQYMSCAVVGEVLDLIKYAQFVQYENDEDKCFMIIPIDGFYKFLIDHNLASVFCENVGLMD